MGPKDPAQVRRKNTGEFIVKGGIVISMIIASLTSFSAAQTAAPTTRPASLGIAWGFLYGYKDIPAARYMPDLRAMGAANSKIYVIWNQLEPSKGEYDWHAIDAYADQLNSPEEGLISVFSSSTWATRVNSDMLPPSPAKNPDDYYRFIFDLVAHCKGKVRYWQNDSEPNNPIFWSGTADEFVSQLKIFYRAVKDADPGAVVVAGGYDGLFNPPNMWQFPNQKAGLAFFDKVLTDAGQSFDVFDLRLYGDPYTIPYRVETIRKKLDDLGLNKPIVCGEYNGPGFFEFAPNHQYFGLFQHWSDSITNGKTTIQNNPIAQMYEKINTLAPETQMFMEGCPKELEAKLRRLQCRELVMQNLLALSAGVRSTLYWDFWHDTSRRDDLMHLMYAKCRLTEIRDGKFTRIAPLADAFERMAQKLDGVERVTLIPIPDKPSVFLFKVDRAAHEPMLVMWERRDLFSGEDQTAVPFEWEWQAPTVHAVDALGDQVSVSISNGKMKIAIGATPIFVENQ
jgi:hypothetical protein